MASKCSRMFNRSSSVSTIMSAISKSLNKSSSSSSSFSARPPLASKSVPSPLRRFSLSRSPAELGAVASMLPLHSAVADARMTSCLSSSSRSSRALSQGTLCCTSPDL
ncbi:hypothetical protein BUALT_Bualt10G0025300 [Buddleja alternifolia]|uniref:Uncharacterized protein n=1 Tax=Buddleja alternifolia TaxID=168488 RepID=A0AAV6X0D0_9LAMI|nr:hypothetical protein BUALT_Bualt10G0025300 [Buddleja alternifolia]